MRDYRLAEPHTKPRPGTGPVRDPAISRDYRLAKLPTKLSPFVQDLALLAIAWGHVFLAPYTKVEEGFNLHAVHDVLMYGVDPNAVRNVSAGFDLWPAFFLRFVVIEYDHKIFPGSVPRTFIGSVLLAWLSTPVIRIAATLGLIDSKIDLQVIGEYCSILLFVEPSAESTPYSSAGARDCQCLWSYSHPPGCVSLVGWINRIPVDLAHLHAITPTVLDGQDAAKHVRVVPWCVGPLSVSHGVLTPCLTPVNVAFSFLIPNAPTRAFPTQPRLLAAISLLVFAGVIFRSEVALLLAPIVTHAIFVVSPVRLIKTGVISAMLSIGKDGHRPDMPSADRWENEGLTILVDSYFWGQYPLWPELSGVYFNVYQGKSSEWGVSRYPF